MDVPGYIAEQPEYDQRGRLIELTAANGVTADFAYDKNDRLSNLTYESQRERLKGYDLEYDNANNLISKNNNSYNYDALNRLVFASLKGKFENNPETENQHPSRVSSDYKGQKALEEVADQAEIIELDYGEGSIGVDLKGECKVTKIKLSPSNSNHRVEKKDLAVYYSSNNLAGSYIKVKDWKLVRKDSGELLIILDQTIKTRYLKVKSYHNDRDQEFNLVNNAEFKNQGQDLIKVYYYVTERSESYNYDAVGNRTKEIVSQRETKEYDYNYYPNSDLLKSNGRYKFEYDDNGNLIKKYSIDSQTLKADGEEVWKYDYDLLNRLIKVTKNDKVVAEYSYNADGLRIKKESSKGSIYYVFDNNDNLLYQQENTEYIQYVYIQGKHFARVDGSLISSQKKTYFYHTDHLGSTVLVTNESGNAVWSSEYTPFGELTMEKGLLDNAAKFTGKDLDKDTGLYYYNARWYDKDVGRFISEDPAHDGVNWYAYVSNNPLIYVDPTGMYKRDEEGNWLYDGNLNIYEGSEMDLNDPEAGLLADYQEINKAFNDNKNKDYDKDKKIKINSDLSLKWGNLARFYKGNRLVKNNITTGERKNSYASKSLLDDGFMSWDEANKIKNSGSLNFDNLAVHYSARYVLNNWLEFESADSSILNQFADVDNRNNKIEALGTVWENMSDDKARYHNPTKNLKWVSSDGRELVLERGTGKLETDYHYFGTYNFGVSKMTAQYYFVHGKKDVLPYYRYGSTPQELFEKMSRIKENQEQLMNKNRR